MILSAKDIAQMMDLSCVKTNSTMEDIRELIQCAKEYEVGQVSVLQCFVPFTKELLRDCPEIRVVGNVSFPSGSDSTTLKVCQAKELVACGCDEIDMVINVGKLLSGDEAGAAEDVMAVVAAANPLPAKVIIEIAYLNRQAVEKACEICIRAGAAFVKTGTGWAEKGTTVADVQLIKSIVGDRIKIKASGGIRDLQTLLEMYQQGARRFGVNLKSGKRILDDAIANSRAGTIYPQTDH
jgi:deoxyribose-phosphate aldolase